MKKLFYIFAFFLPIAVCAQQSWYKSSPLDYAWKNVGNAGFSEGAATGVIVAFSPFESQPYVAYFLNKPDSSKVAIMKFDGTNWVNIGLGVYFVGVASFLSFALSPYNGQPYVVFEDGYQPDTVRVMKFDGTKWVNVGNAVFSSGCAWYTSLAFNSSGELYLEYGDSPIVMKFDGTNWVRLGTQYLPAHYNTSLAISPSGQPYIAFSDWDHNDYASVMKFNGTNWVNVGNADFSAGMADEPHLVFHPSGQPYLAFKDYGNSLKATVMKFDGTEWVNVGNAGFSAERCSPVSIAFNPSGQPYVAFEEGGQDSSTVMKFNGTNWVNVGNTGFTKVGVQNLSLAFSPSGQPYVAFTDYWVNQKATVMKYDSVYVGINEQQKSRLSLYPNPAIDKIIIETSAIPTKCQLSIMNLNGQQLITRQITDEPKTQIDISTLPAGVYFLRITGERTVEVGKFIKQ